MRLRVRDLRRYLTLRDISTDACTEKEELVELVLQHMGVDLQEEEEEEEEDLESEEANIEAAPSALALPVDAAPTTPQQPALSVSAPQEETHRTNNSSGTSQVHMQTSTLTLICAKETTHNLGLMAALIIMMCVCVCV